MLTLHTEVSFLKLPHTNLFLPIFPQLSAFPSALVSGSTVSPFTFSALHGHLTFCVYVVLPDRGSM